MAMNVGGHGRVMSDINVTPMVDVMLVLLIIFMVTAPLMQQGVDVELPQTKSPTLDVDPDLAILAVTKERRIFLGKTEIPYEQLRDKLVSNIKLREDKEIYLHADRDLNYGFVVDIMAIMKEAGVVTLSMVTDPLEPNPKRRK
ncbi:MAG: biopolymer transporter ExbD [Myxococcota bacterium]